MITRNNYEEYFLLYVDNELSTAERNAVEEFVQQNPDLANELTMIQGSVFKPEKNIIFNNKESLLKNVVTNSIINLSNYEEYFLLYIDNELDVATKKLVEEFVSKNPSLQNEWDILQQTKIEADHSIVFEGKESLYKKEERRRVVPFAWITSAAAVAVLLVTGFLFFNKTDKAVKITNESIAQNDSIKKDKSTGKTKPTIAVTSTNVDTLNNEQDGKKNVVVKELKTEKQLQSKSLEAIQKKIEKENKAEQKDLAVVNTAETSKKENPIESVEAVKTIARIASTNTSSSNIDVAPKKLVVLVDKADDKFNTNENKSSYAISTTTVTEDPTSNDDSEKKNKLRGIFRRVSRVFNKSNADDDSSKRSVSIGSFQIALK